MMVIDNPGLSQLTALQFNLFLLYIKMINRYFYILLSVNFNCLLVRSPSTYHFKLLSFNNCFHDSHPIDFGKYVQLHKKYVRHSYW